MRTKDMMYPNFGLRTKSLNFMEAGELYIPGNFSNKEGCDKQRVWVNIIGNKAPSMRSLLSGEFPTYCLFFLESQGNGIAKIRKFIQVDLQNKDWDAKWGYSEKNNHFHCHLLIYSFTGYSKTIHVLISGLNMMDKEPSSWV